MIKGIDNPVNPEPARERAATEDTIGRAALIQGWSELGQKGAGAAACDAGAELVMTDPYGATADGGKRKRHHHRPAPHGGPIGDGPVPPVAPPPEPINPVHLRPAHKHNSSEPQPAPPGAPPQKPIQAIKGC